MDFGTIRRNLTASICNKALSHPHMSLKCWTKFARRRILAP
jgi:hypothetical protein